ncbi:ankyrin repeat and LEM domain-containing protein 2-like [Dreissena polymorpha]|uniref:LEM domain-containing protein n=1 Tax=Dreissena polymorpha TaxID=45954 RepID=A0A9D4KNQ5_DREPO|nr:ankyrin repeat and LEM domain-containing protein 2-like [Dreissena polymorpha]KAH3842859.1 hypothetical protein DPMN_116363 [Dreissena polymorpha]
MEAILEEIKKYDVQTLRKKLLENGIKVGPIAPSTASLFQKRLAKHLFKLQGGSLDEDDNASPKQPVNKAEIVPLDKDLLDSSLNATNIYYAVCLPQEVDRSNAFDNKENRVFTDKISALQLAKKFKGSRFKVFKNEQEAEVFSQSFAETVFASPRRPSKEDSKEPSVSTESSPYKAPKPQDLAELRQAIETGDVKTFQAKVWDNPRYMVSSGDTPAIYQEGPRYSAMHVAALKNQAAMCQSILDILEDPQFVIKLYSQSVNTEETMNQRINFLVDLYLNMPDKGNCDSPLHMACKFGHAKVVEVLAAHPKTDKQLKNKWGDTPKDLICTRCTSSSAGLKDKIEELLMGQVYVPLIRSEDNTVPPVIGQPWSPDLTGSPLDNTRIPCSPRESPMSVRACAGPMSPSNAGLFHKRWTTSPSQSPDKAREYQHMKRSDCDKGLERIGRQLAAEMKIPWREYWEFLDQFVDLSTPQGLETLEGYFKKRVWQCYIKTFKDRHCIIDETDNASAGSMGFSTPVNRRQRTGLFADSAKSLDSVFEKKINKTEPLNKTSRRLSNSFQDTKDDSEHLSPEEDKSQVQSVSNVNGIVSPITNLAQTFEKLQLLDDSWYEHATVDSEHGNDLESGTDDAKDINLEKGSGLFKTNKVSNSCDKQENSVKIGKSLGNSEDSTSKTAVNEEMPTNTVIVEKDLGKSTDCVNTAKNNGELLVKPEESMDKIQRYPSVSSGSTESFETAEEVLSEKSLSFCSQVSELGNSFVCIRICDTNVFQKLLEFVNENSPGNPEDNDIEMEPVLFILQWQAVLGNESQKINIISLTHAESLEKILVLENVVVAVVEGDIFSQQEGDVVEIRGPVRESSSTTPAVNAYLTRMDAFRNCGYIHGPQPTREDLDVSRAIGDVTVSSELYPNVFQWKLSLTKFLSNTKYRWQSPAKFKPMSRLASPQPSPRGKTSPVIPYGSPVGLGSTTRNHSATSDIRTKLFPSIKE